MGKFYNQIQDDDVMLTFFVLRRRRKRIVGPPVHSSGAKTGIPSKFSEIWQAPTGSPYAFEAGGRDSLMVLHVPVEPCQHGTVKDGAKGSAVSLCRLHAFGTPADCDGCQKSVTRHGHIQRVAGRTWEPR
jgi:hypothetical protein